MVILKCYFSYIKINFIILLASKYKISICYYYCWLDTCGLLVIAGIILPAIKTVLIKIFSGYNSFLLKTGRWFSPGTAVFYLRQVGDFLRVQQFLTWDRSVIFSGYTSFLLETDRWFSPGTPVSSTNKTDHHEITKILLKVALNTITLTLITESIHLLDNNYSLVVSSFLLRIYCLWWTSRHTRKNKGRWFSPGTPVSSTNKTDRHEITKILLKVALNTITLTLIT